MNIVSITKYGVGGDSQVERSVKDLTELRRNAVTGKFYHMRDMGIIAGSMITEFVEFDNAIEGFLFVSDGEVFRVSRALL